MLVLLRYGVTAVLLGLWVYSILDVVRSEAEEVQHLHKLVWLVFVLLFPPIGAIAWLLLGRPAPVGARWTDPGPPPASLPPDDSPEFLAHIDDEIKRRRRAARTEDPLDDDDIAAEIARLEEELRKGSDDDPDLR